jgi:hypothetical protein
MPESSPRTFATRDVVRLVLAPVMVFVATSLDRGYQTDYWQHLARGALIAREGAVVSVDRFTYTVPGRAFYDNNWLTQLLYYGLNRAGDIRLVQFVNSLVLAGAVAGLVALCRRTSRSTSCAAAAGVVAFFGLWPTMLIRPQTFSVALFVALYALLTVARRRPRLLVWSPVMMALWANAHGGFAVGLVLIFAFALAATFEHLGARLLSPSSSSDEGDTSAAPTGAGRVQQLLPLVACLVVSAAATLANPYGWNVYRYAGRLSAVGVARGVEEWLPPTVASPIGLVFFATLALVAFLVVVQRQRPTPTDACVLICFALPACAAVRMTVWWHLAAAPVLARLAADALRRPAFGPSAAGASAWPSRVAGPALVALASVCVLSLPWMERFSPVLGSLRPAARTESDLQAVADRLTGREGARVFAPMEWSNYLAWSLRGRCRVFVEGHVELYPDETWRQYATVAAGATGWERVLDDYAVDYLLLDEDSAQGLLPRVRQSPRWGERMRSGPAVLFGRREAADTVAGASTDF